MSGVPNAMQGFSQNRDQPIQIEAASLEMRDKKKEATFSGNVKVVQGDTTMTSKTLVVFYEFRSGAATPRARRTAKGAKSAPMQSATPGPGGSSSIRRLEAKGTVVVTQKDQVVTGETAIFDTRANLITMVGRGRADPVQERAARRPPEGGHDDRRVAGRIRQRQGAGHVRPVASCGSGSGAGQATGRHSVADPREKITEINAVSSRAVWRQQDLRSR